MGRRLVGRTRIVARARARARARTRARNRNRQRNRVVGGLLAGGGDARNGGVFVAAHGVAVLVAERDVVEPGVVERGDGGGDALAVQVTRNAGLAGLLGNDDGNRGAGASACRWGSS